MWHWGSGLGLRAARRLANEAQFFKSDHTFLDGSNLNDKGKDTSQLTEEEANKLFRFSDQTWLEHDRDPLLQRMMVGRPPARAPQFGSQYARRPA